MCARFRIRVLQGYPVFRFLLSATLLLLLASCSSTQVINGMTTNKNYDPYGGVIYNDATGLGLDIYTPKESVEGAPVVVFFYGGRWSGGIRSEYKFVGQALTQQGFLVLVPDVRVYPQVRFPTFVQDAAKAVAWAREHAAEYGGNPNKLFVMGHQSGAHIAAMLALNPQFLKEVGGSRGWLRGMIGLAGPYDFELTGSDLRDMFGPPDDFPKSQPINYVDGRNPPLLLLHGEKDTDVKIKNTRNLAAAVQRAGGPVEMVLYPDLDNNWLLASIAAPVRKRSDVLKYITAFIRQHANDAPRASADGRPAAQVPLSDDAPTGLQTVPLK